MSANGQSEPRKGSLGDIPPPTLGEKIIEGKTKAVYNIVDSPGLVFIKSKDKITAQDGAKSHDLAGKAAISTSTATKIFNILSKSGVKNHFVRQHDDTSFIARKCDMIPIEWVTRRVATGSFLKRNEGVKEGFRFNPPKLEFFYKDDANHDPQWSREQILENKLVCGGVTIGEHEVDILSRTTICVFEILEKAWASVDCALVDMKIEFGVDMETGEVILSDIIDSDSWRLWNHNDSRLKLSKQVYRDAQNVTGEVLQQVKLNFQWVADKADLLFEQPPGRVVVFMGSPSDKDHCVKIRDCCSALGVPCHLRVSSAHKGTEETLGILAQYEGDGIPTVFIAVAGRSNGLGPVLSGNASWPVINCPPISADWGAEDVWSSLRLPSGLGCSTVIYPEAAALQAAQILGLHNHIIWARLRAKALNTWIGLKVADKHIQEA
ncbi:hypothetical protein CAPTEDRAFT_168449 [Capitella teleta]|uniref:PurE domain-containing protein n=1 Tax=Capitella teleta TaxID=283909 RepID=R7UBB7_CAPTE|nr:hypothetical protein CAPTEDRAFT_168449 [Capitella teleta]|eukprot:ELU03401.1 hypothetical protein CAPTEDRAFT_168449 [Capitella teleta]